MCFWHEVKDGEVEVVAEETEPLRQPEKEWYLYSIFDKPEEEPVTETSNLEPVYPNGQPEVEDEKPKRTFSSDSNVYHFHPIAFVEHMKRIEGLEDIDLSDPDKWMSQFDNPINPNQACYRTSVIVLNNYGVECGGLGSKMSEQYANGTNKWSNVIQMVVQIKDGTLKNTGREDEAIKYIDEQLEKHSPILVGVDRERYATYNKDNSTEHFFVITGRLTDASGVMYYRYFEVGTHSQNKESKGISTENRLYIGSDKRLTGKPSYSNVTMTVTQIRRNIDKNDKPIIY